jgi:hypothetical protein
MLSTRNHFKYEDIYRVKIKGWRKVYHTNTDHKKAGVTILISDR